MMTCPSCNATIKSLAKFCPRCGVNLRLPITKNVTIYIIQLASLLLLIQNLFLSFPVLIVLAMLLSDISPFIFYSILSMLFYLDIIGFLLLGIGYTTFMTPDFEEKKPYLITGICIILWVVCRLLWQFFLTGNLLGDLNNYLQTPTGAMGILELWAEPLDDIKFPFFIGGLALSFASIMLFRARKEVEERLFMVYGINNMIAVLLIFLPLISFPIFNLFTSITAGSGPSSILGLFILAPYFGLFMKLFIIPLLGVLSFLKLLLKYK